MRDSDEVKEELFRSCKQKLMEKVVFDSLKAQIMIRTKIIAGKGWEPSNLACLFSCKNFFVATGASVCWVAIFIQTARK